MFKSLIFALGLTVVLPSYVMGASIVDQLAGPEVTSLKYDFNRYDYDATNGKLAGPFFGSIELQRPGYLHISTLEGEITLDANGLRYLACAKCLPISLDAKKVLGERMLAFIQYGKYADALFPSAEAVKLDGGLERTQVSLAGLGAIYRTALLWHYLGQPTGLEIDVSQNQKVILQFIPAANAVQSEEELVK